ncbi:Uma2 family endonuclease [Glycomyces sp. YM15]|uniref:Uma2 family endonuclease n=1 Tax=Glycomyces sp. YM15 TaxID=2800446 RepID=UPI001965E75B|nr:Uma2 family endonuclease [Glycomyces sp. YM15]
MTMTLPKPDTTEQSYDDDRAVFRRLLNTASDWDMDGFNAEVFGRNIVVSPWSKGSYRRPMKSLVRQLDQHAPEGHEAGAEPFLFVFPEHSGALGPDICVADVEMVDIDSNLLPGTALSLVAELTSPATRKNDFTAKAVIYGRAGVPVYLLFDMKERMLTVFSDPSPRHGYQSRTSAEFGKPVHVPEPFDFELDTTAFNSEGR